MSTTVWKGHVAFGMVSFPVKLQAAARSQSVQFHQLHGEDHSRVKQVLYCQAEDRPVARAKLVKGFEYEKDRYVVLNDADLARAEPRTARVMEMLEFVSAAEVDPVYLDASYYVLPEAAGVRPYTLLFEAMRRRGMVALAQWTAHNREHLVLLRPGPFGLILHTLYYHDEVRALEEFRTDASQIQGRELELATLLVDSLAAAFEPAKYRDSYRENLRAELDAKTRGEEVAAGTTAPELRPVMDILEALKASVAKTRKPIPMPSVGAALPSGAEAELGGKRRKRA
jgi:DNA end-binding protein Ku